MLHRPKFGEQLLAITFYTYPAPTPYSYAERFCQQLSLGTEYFLATLDTIEHYNPYPRQKSLGRYQSIWKALTKADSAVNWFIQG